MIYYSNDNVFITIYIRVVLIFRSLIYSNKTPQSRLDCDKNEFCKVWE